MVLVVIMIMKFVVPFREINDDNDDNKDAVASLVIVFLGHF